LIFCGKFHRQIRRTLERKNANGKLFFAPIARHNLRVTTTIGAFLNAIGILLGALFGLAQRKPISARTQLFFRNALGAATIFFGLQLVWLNVNGNFLSCAKQVFIALLALVLGNLLGKLLSLQKISNHFGRFAGNLIADAQKNPPHKMADGFKACAILFCAAPLGILGAVTDGLSGDFYLLAVKAVMDGLAMASFVKMFGWFSALSAFPVFIFLGAITFAVQFYAKPFLDPHNLIDSVNAAAGFVACAVALVIFEVRKVELANYLPALAVAPLLSWFFK
jgi:uncharacterized membrane protein YqgA involved in biofilm formation